MPTLISFSFCIIAEFTRTSLRIEQAWGREIRTGYQVTNQMVRSVHDLATCIVIHISYNALMSRKSRYLATILSCRCHISQLLLHTFCQNIIISWCGAQLLRNSAQRTKCTEQTKQANFQPVFCKNNTFPFFWACPFLCG